MQVRTTRDIGSLIRAARLSLGWDQRRLAEEVGVSRLWVGEIERGKPGAKLDLVLRTLKALDIPLHADLPGQPAPVVRPKAGEGGSRSALLIDRLLDRDRG